ncbi:hypothetical protein LTR70_010522 [Exophiala xenobiotica]|uniref:Uncharacterized protein n=1 Tax=Lithohypha guttulata TaxID=1690604 RepID=A0ABR0JUR9_9EURO|nr:hypothetical protein LTR24_010443 [Lithohypha guttulata]KAK5309196.1 hypothetical protein LTR70_010522 [Exophiala xenobiotica]
MKEPLIGIVWVTTMLIATPVVASLPLFGGEGPQVSDIRAVRTSTGWFEVLTTGMVMTSADLLTANMTDVNETHADISLWKPAASSTIGPPEAVTVAIAKRPWSSESPYTWPAALYDAFHALYATSLEQNTMTDGDAATLNASQLFHAVYGQAVMAQCATTVTDQLLLVQHNTAAGPVVEAVTHTDIAADTVQHVYQTSGHIEVATSSRSSWWADCNFLFWRGIGT